MGPLLCAGSLEQQYQPMLPEPGLSGTWGGGSLVVPSWPEGAVLSEPSPVLETERGNQLPLAPWGAQPLLA